LNKRSRRSRFPFVIGILLLFLIIVASGITLRVIHLMPPSISGLHVSGNKLVNGNGETIIPHGVNRSGTEYMCLHGGGFFEGPSDAASVDAMASWQINTVRIPLNEDCWLGINGVPDDFSGLAYQKAILNYVYLLNEKNIIAILDLHWSAPGMHLATKQLAMPDADHSVDFWSSVATTFKNNSSVMFDLYNEPFPKTWACWLQGSTALYTAPCEDVDFAVAGMQTLVNTVRSHGAHNVLITSGLGYASYLVDWNTNHPQDPDHNLMASFHAYNFTGCASIACLSKNIQPVLDNTPVIVAELGENDCQHGFIDQTMSWLDQQQVGYLGWAWDVASCKHFPALITNYDGTPTSFGVGLKQHFSDLASNPLTIADPGYTTRSTLASITNNSSLSLTNLFLEMTWWTRPSSQAFLADRVSPL
jgi:Cellulase (glycosyl hydrolase family 5)